MFAAGSITAGGDVLAMNLPMDRDAEHWARDFAALKAQRRHLRHRRADRADRARCPATSPGRCERGRVKGSLLLAPDARRRGSSRSTCPGRRRDRRAGWRALALAVVAAVAALAQRPAARASGAVQLPRPAARRRPRRRHADRARPRRRARAGLADAAALLDPAVAAPPRRRRWPISSPAGCGCTLDGRPVAVDAADLTPVPDRQALRFTLARRRRAGRPGRLDVDATLFPYDPQHQTFVNVYEDGALRHQAILDARPLDDGLLRRLVARRRRGARHVRAGRASTTSPSAPTTSCSWSACCSSAARWRGSG